MPQPYGLNIDDPEDFEQAERILPGLPRLP